MGKDKSKWAIEDTQMVKKPCLISLMIREIQIKAMISQFHSKKNHDHVTCCWECSIRSTLQHCTVRLATGEQFGNSHISKSKYPKTE